MLERRRRELGPSTADSTEIAGVITESPRTSRRRSRRGIKTSGGAPPERAGGERRQRQVPPSPLLSARSRIRTYLSVTVTISAQRISESTPSTTFRADDWVSASRDCRLAERVERASPDIAVDDADAAERQGKKPWREHRRAFAWRP